MIGERALTLEYENVLASGRFSQEENLSHSYLATWGKQSKLQTQSLSGLCT